MAPNMITLIGLFANLLTLSIFLLLDTTCTQVLPLPVTLLMPVTLFLYQTMDAIDGK